MLLVMPAPVVAQDGGHEAGPVRRAISVIGRDLKALASSDSVTLLSSATALALLASPFDETLTHQASSSTFLKTTFDGWARRVGQEWALGSGALATFIVGRATGHARTATVGGDLIEAQVVSGVMTVALKYAVDRERPDGEARSFPSGHAAGTFATATVIHRHYGWKASVPAYAAAVLVSGARLQANSHYATDVIAGAAVGVLAGRAVTFDIAGSQVSMAPIKLTGGAAVTFHVKPGRRSSAVAKP